MNNVLVLSGLADDGDKMGDPKLVVQVMEGLAKKLGVPSNASPYCVRMVHPDPTRTFIVAGVVSRDRAVLLDTKPGQAYLELRMFSSGELEGLQEEVKQFVCETFGPGDYELDVQKLEHIL